MPYLKMERRKKRRIEAILPLEIIYGRNKINAQSKNISMLGTLVDNEQGIPTGTNAEIVVHIPAYGHYHKPVGPITGQGTIFHSTLISQPPNTPFFRLGIFFASFSTKEDADKLSSYIDYAVSKEKTFLKKRLKQLRAKLRREKKLLKKLRKKTKAKPKRKH